MRGQSSLDAIRSTSSGCELRFASDVLRLRRRAANRIGRPRSLCATLFAATPVRIVFTSTYSWPEVRRGGERYVHELAASLTRAGHDVSILSSAPRAGRDVVLGVPVTRLRRRRLWSSRFGELSPDVAFGAQALLRLLPHKVDVWHALTTSDAAAAATVGMLRPGVRTATTDLGIPMRSYWDRRADRRLYEWAVQRLDVFGCLSEVSARSLQRDFGRDGTVVGAGVDLRSFAPGDRRHERPAILFPASVDEPRKNARLLLAALGVLLERGLDAELWLAGPGDTGRLLEDCSPAVRAAVTIRELVPLDRLRELYRTAWVTALPSHHEAFGLTIIESFASGTPAVGLANGGGPAEPRDGRLVATNGPLHEATLALLSEART